MVQSSYFGLIEPHAPLLVQPADDQALFKIMAIDDFERSLAGAYLFFKRVDTYQDDENDGALSPVDRDMARQGYFEKAPHRTLDDYYSDSRRRTYACCFSKENSRYIWENYGGSGGPETKVAVCTTFGTLRRLVNESVARQLASEVEWVCHLSVNYGCVWYTDWQTDRLTDGTHPNPILATFHKDRVRFQHEQELRIALSAFGMGQLQGRDGSPFTPPDHLCYPFDLKSALERGDFTLLLDSREAFPRLASIAAAVGLRIAAAPDLP
ncbi:hypothetical protein [Neotabrizicola sp. VNH66]|uniref:hypothetical protein n=1 Tax=Neotabrizicola sp. VNH66 TaxID=3400918 RepID=UPI003BFF4C0F